MASMQKVLGICFSSRTKYPLICMTALKNGYTLSASSTKFQRKFIHISRCLNKELPAIDFMLTDYLGDKETSPLVRPFRNKMNEYKLNKHFRLHSNKEELIGMCTKAILQISNCIADGQFEQLEGYVDPELLSRLRKRYPELTQAEKNYLRITDDHLVMKDIDSISITTNKETKTVIAEVIVGLVGTHGAKDFLANHPQHVNLREPFSCIYLFRSELSGGDTTFWKVMNLNQVNPYNKATHV